MSEGVEGIRDAGAWWSAVAQRVIELMDRAEAQGFVEIEFELFGVAKKIKFHVPPKVA